MKGELELCSLGDGLSIGEGARHAAENTVVDFNHLVDGLGGHILPKEKDGEAVSWSPKRTAHELLKICPVFSKMTENCHLLLNVVIQLQP